MKEERDLGDYWTSPKVVLKCVGPKLVPFFKTAAVYFVLSIQRENPSWLSCLLKCLPVIWLCIFVVLHGMSLGEKHMYSRRILSGLIFSCIGDAFLVWPSCFLWGMISFAIAHIIYISAFGMHPWNPIVGMVCSALAGICYYVFYPGLYGIYTVCVPIYIFVLSLMVWRAVARVQFFEDLWTWTRLCSCGGGILFAISDTLIGVRIFCTQISIPHAQTLTMLIYYAAQLGIALSVVDSTAMAVLSAVNENQNTCCNTIKQNTLQLKSLKQRLILTGGEKNGIRRSTMKLH